MSGVRLSEAISGRASRHASRSSIVMSGPPPVVSLMMMSGQRSRIFRLTSYQISAVVAGRVRCLGSRAWTCTIEAPARYAPYTESASSSAVSGRCSLDSFPWIPPLHAQQMITGGMPTRTCSMKR